MLGTPFPPWPSFSEADVAAVADVLRSGRVNYWTGQQGREFEREFAAWAGSAHAIALNNGTVALDAALHGLRIKAGDEVVVTPRSFIASVSSVVLAGATPVFADVDRDDQNLTAESIAAVLTPRTRAVVVVHLAGWPAQMDGILALAREKGLAVIEDCAQANGATYRGRNVGTLGDVGAWSFCQDKIITTGGEGGMVTTDDRELWSRMWSYKDHGKSWDAVYGREHPPGFRWVHESFGTNGRMIEMQSVIGRRQLALLPEWSARRRANADAIWDAARESPGVRAPVVPAWIEHGAYRAYAFVEPAALRADWSRDRVIAEIVARDVPCYAGSCSEIYRERAFDGTGFAPRERLPVAHELGDTSLMFLVHPTLEPVHVDRTCEALRDVMRRAVR